MNKPKNTLLCLPQIALSDALRFPAIQSLQDKRISKNNQDWQARLLKELGQKTAELPIDRLRAEALDLDKKYRTRVCCDLVAMQMTHRGAYLWGQNQLVFSQKDNQKILRQINEKLMASDEQMILYDTNQWMYLSEREIALKENSFSQYIGRDMFSFDYQGEEAIHWQMLATEIQMLIKQMMDYQGLTQMPPEWIAGVHFYGEMLSSKNQESALASQTWQDLSSKPLVLSTNQSLLETFAVKSSISQLYLDLEKSQEVLETAFQMAQGKKLWVLAESVGHEQLIALVEKFTHLSQQYHCQSEIVFADQSLAFNQPSHGLAKLFQLFRRH